MAKTANTDSRDKCRFVTDEFRVSYPHVFKAQGLAGSKPKFSVTMLFSKKADLSKIKLAIKHAKIAQWVADPKNWAEKIESPVVDGDAPKYADKEGYKGHWAIKASTSEDARPGVVDRDLEPITDPSVFYPGCFARAQVFARVWEFPKDSGRFGIHFILDHVQKTKEGKSFSNRKDAAEVFDPIAGSDDEEVEETADEDGGFM